MPAFSNSVVGIVVVVAARILAVVVAVAFAPQPLSQLLVTWSNVDFFIDVK